MRRPPAGWGVGGRPHTAGAPASRREFLKSAGMGLGLLGLAGVLDRSGLLAADGEHGAGLEGPLAPRAGHLPARAKAVIWLFMYGGPSGVDLFDPKPELQKRHGQRLEPGSVDAFFGKPGPLMRSPFEFARHGQCGAWLCDRLPALAGCVDDIAFIRSCRAESNNHAPALLQMNSGMTRMGFPSAGSWVTYGLGSENRNLPGFVVMYDPRGVPVGGPSLWSSGFLPGSHAGTRFRPQGSPLLHLELPEGMEAEDRRAQLDLLARLNAGERLGDPGGGELETRIRSFELAHRMQMEAPEAVDLSGESEATCRLYGMESDASRDYGTRLLIARRLVERGVRFIQVYSGGPGGEWDAHSGLRQNHAERCAETDAPVAGLLADLKQRGLLDSTLVVWGGEFGRLPVSQDGTGRDHNPHGFHVWMAGGGIRGGASYGETDELGHHAVRDPVTVPDLHATILHQLGLDHRRLTYRHNGREHRLTDTSGNVLQRLLA